MCSLIHSETSRNEQYYKQTKTDVDSFVDASRKCSLQLRDILKDELQNMEEHGVIRNAKKTQKTTWIGVASLRRCMHIYFFFKVAKQCPQEMSTQSYLIVVAYKCSYSCAYCNIDCSQKLRIG